MSGRLLSGHPCERYYWSVSEVLPGMGGSFPPLSSGIYSTYRLRKHVTCVIFCTRTTLGTRQQTLSQRSSAPETPGVCHNFLCAVARALEEAERHLQKTIQGARAQLPTAGYQSAVIPGYMCPIYLKIPTALSFVSPCPLLRYQAFEGPTECRNAWYGGEIEASY